MTSLLLLSSLFFVETIQNPRGVFPSLLGSTGVVHIESAIPSEHLDFSVQAWGGFFFDDPYISVDKHSRNRMRLSFNLGLPKGLEVFSGTGFVFNESSNASNSRSSTSFFENTDIGLRWGRWISEGFFALGAQAYGRFFSGTQARRNKSGFSRESSGPIAQGNIKLLASLDFKNRMPQFPLRSHLNLGFRSPNSDLSPSGNANREDQTELFNLDANKYNSLIGGLAFEVPTRWINPFVEFSTEYALFAKKADNVKFSSNRSRITTGFKVTPHQSVALLAAADFGLLGNNADTLVGIPQNNPWEAYVGIAFTANSRDLFKTSGRMRGMVTDAETGLPLPDVEVTLVGEVTLPRVTDLAGVYEMPNLEVKTYQVRFIKDGYQSSTSSVRISGGETSVLDMALKRPGPRVGGIQASIMDSTTGAPVPRAFARISGVESPLAADERGLLKGQELEVGQKTIRIEAPGYIPAEFPIEIFENETFKQDFTLQKEPTTIGSFSGRVTNEEGTGLTAVFSSAQETISPFGTNPVNGNFNQPLPAGEYELKVVAENYLPETIQLSIKAGETTPRDIVLKKPETAVVVDNRIILPDAIFFDFNKAKIQERSFETLNQIVEILKANDGGYKILRVEGHTDDVGSNTYNEALSKRRAESVRDYLIKRGVGAERLEAVGYGELKPIATNLTDAGRGENRRVEFYLVREGEDQKP